MLLALSATGRLAAGETSSAAISEALHAGNPQAAIALATQALSQGQLSPLDRARVLMNRGLARERLGLRDDALVDFTQAIGLRVLPAPDQARAIFDRGVTLDEQGRIPDAIGDYSAALKVQPQFPAALNNRANAYRRLGRFGEAQHDYEASIAAGNRQPEYVDYGLGQIAEARGNVAAARDRYREALAANPQYALASQRLAALGDPAATVAITLRPPAAKAVQASDSIVLRRPEPRRHGIAVAQAPVAAPGLRPALTESTRTCQTKIQLGAWRDRAAAEDGWRQVVHLSGKILDGLTPQITAVDLPGKGRYYRLRIGLANCARTHTICDQLRARQFACFLAKG